MTPPACREGTPGRVCPVGVAGSSVDRERCLKSGKKPPQASRGAVGALGRSGTLSPKMSPGYPRGVAAKGTVTSLPRPMGTPTARGVLGHPENTRLGTGRPEPGQQEKSQPPWSNQTSERNSKGLQRSGMTPRAFPSWEVGEQTEGPQGSGTRRGWGGHWAPRGPGGFSALGVGRHHKVPAPLASALSASPSPVPQVPHPVQTEEFLPHLSQI